MKEIHDLLADLLVVKWNFDNRNVLYRDVLEKWEEYQIEMILEESNELIVQLALNNIMISKMRRDKEKGIRLHYLELLNAYLHRPNQVDNLVDELADTIIMLDEFNVQFMEKVVARIFFKLDRLEKRRKGENNE